MRPTLPPSSPPFVVSYGVLYIQEGSTVGATLSWHNGFRKGKSNSAVGRSCLVDFEIRVSESLSCHHFEYRQGVGNLSRYNL